jgi:hypothetical protein
MSKAFERQVTARKELQAVWEHPEQVNVIHYSCESFYDRPDGSSPRITSIAVRNLKSGQTRSFSIHKYGEIKGLKATELIAHYNELEKEMLDAFAALCKEQKEYRWLHWNMRDENYGFNAIELRHRILGGEPFSIQDDKKLDLSRILVGIFGKAYIGHPRLESLMTKNKISTKNFKTGAEEAQAFNDGNYVGLHQSTLAKVDVLANLCQLTNEGGLKTNARWKDIHGHSVKAFIGWFSNNPYITFPITIVSILANVFFIFGR